MSSFWTYPVLALMACGKERGAGGHAAPAALRQEHPHRGHHRHDAHQRCHYRNADLRRHWQPCRTVQPYRISQSERALQQLNLAPRHGSAKGLHTPPTLPPCGPPHYHRRSVDLCRHWQPCCTAPHLDSSPQSQCECKVHPLPLAWPPHERLIFREQISAGTGSLAAAAIACYMPLAAVFILEGSSLKMKYIGAHLLHIEQSSTIISEHPLRDSSEKQEQAGRIALALKSSHRHRSPSARSWATTTSETFCDTPPPL